jgi:hypothetical protein
MRCSSVRSRIQLAGGILIVSLLCACDSESAQEVADSPLSDNQPPADALASVPADACEVLPGSDVQSVLGEPVRDSLALKMPDTEGPATLSQCNYATADNPAAVSLLLRRNAPGESVETASRSVRQTLSESNVQVDDVPTLGEIAFWGGNQLHVFVGQEWYVVISPVPAAGLEQARSLADLALSRL